MHPAERAHHLGRIIGIGWSGASRGKRCDYLLMPGRLGAELRNCNARAGSVGLHFGICPGWPPLDVGLLVAFSPGCEDSVLKKMVGPRRN
jgi:hypothetical protein